MVRFVLSGFFCLVCVRGPNKKCTAKQSIAGQDRNRYTGDFPADFILPGLSADNETCFWFLCAFLFVFFTLSCVRNWNEERIHQKMSPCLFDVLFSLPESGSNWVDYVPQADECSRAKQIITLVDCMPYNIHPWLCRRYSIESHLLCKVWAWAWWVRHIENGAMNCSYPIVIMNNNISNWNCLR